MGYECPVCATEEADGEHLANHLAFTALVRGGDHEAWLDEHAPDWADRDPEGLAGEVTDYATETDAEPTSEPHDHNAPAVERTGEGDLSGDAAEILAEAEEMTRRMREGGENTEDGQEHDSGGDGASERDGDAESEREHDSGADSENE